MEVLPWRYISGLEADQKVIAAHGCYAMTATTALTAQNTLGVADVHHVPPRFVERQMDACFDDIGVDVVKVGMLASAETVAVVADCLRRHASPDLVCIVDPVMIATSGARLLPEDALDNMKTLLLPLTTILTPNLPEARLLAGAAADSAAIAGVNQLTKLAGTLLELGPQYVLLKGGHAPLDVVGPNGKKTKMVYDVLAGAGVMLVLKSEHVESRHTHGTGCSLASAIASNIACGMSIPEAVKAANLYISAAIRTAPGLGKGGGPINHFHSSYKLPFTPGGFVDYLLSRPEVAGVWRQNVEHDFVLRMADGTLPVEAFQNYLVQDYLFLVQFARANALAAYKAQDIETITKSSIMVGHVHHEMRLHLEYCAEFGLSKGEVEAHEEGQACTAYTRYVLEVGQSSDWFALQIAMAPCLLGYAEIGRRLYHDPATKRAGNRYWKWIESYAGDEYAQAVYLGRGVLEEHAPRQSVARTEELVRIFIHATKMEIGFWDLGSSARGQ